MDAAPPPATAWRPRRRSRTVVYAGYGFLIGCAFPVVGWFVDHLFLFRALPDDIGLAFVQTMHRLTPIHYFIDAIPLILAVVSAFVGRKQEQVLYYSNHLEDLVDERTRALRETTEHLIRAKRETDQILENVDEGLFLLGPQLSLGDQYAAALERILDNSDLGGQSFAVLIGELLGPAAADRAVRFLELLFRDDLDEGMLGDLNPLRAVTLRTGQGADERHVQFRFSRIAGDDTVSDLLGIAKDVTAETRLKQQIAAQEARNRRQMELVLAVLKVEPPTLADFLASAERGLARAASAVGASLHTLPTAELRELRRTIHTLKGNAGLMDLTPFEALAHRLESALDAVLAGESAEHAGDPVALVAELCDMVEEIHRLLRRMSGLHRELAAGTNAGPEHLLRALSAAVDRLAAELGKAVELRVEGAAALPADEDRREALRDVLVQLVRNAVVHGIELPDDREAAGKARRGCIELSVRNEADALIVRLADDGRGLQTHRLRQRAVETGMLNAADLDGWNDDDLAALIFEPSLSTAETTSTAAGRGVGMDIVKSRIEALGGRIELASLPGRGCVFTLLLPALSVAAGRAER